jgi:signal transduction histidine kinase
MTSQPIRILYVDDYRLDRELVRDVLTRENSNFDLFEAASRTEFEKALAEGGFDLVLSDFNILGFEGLQVLEAVHTRDADVPIIIVTGTGSEEVAVEAMKLGAADYVIKKPHHLQRLPLTIKAVMEKRQADQKNRDAEAQAQALKTELEVHHRLIDLREQDRAQIARDLHDGPLQGLMALGFDLQQVAAVAAGQAVERPIRDMRTNLQSEIDKLRSFTSDLRSPVLYKFGLAKAIRSHVETFGEKHPELALRVETDVDDGAIPQTIRSGLFRIYQEALNNIAVHAHATRVEIRLKQTQDSLQLEISDDGQGFSLPQDWLDLVRSGHFGLVGMRERAEALDGRAEFISHPGGGTQVRVWVPLSV